MITPLVSKTIKWEAGHRLLNYDGLCRFYHGHSYRAQIVIGSKYILDDMGFVVDFSEIKEKVKTWIDKNWDHAFLLNSNDKKAIRAMKNDKIYLFNKVNPTAENIVQELYFRAVKPNFSRVEEKLIKSSKYGFETVRTIFPYSVTVWETEDSCATYGIQNPDARGLQVVAK